MKKGKIEQYKKKLLKKHEEITANYAKNKGNSKEDVRNGTEDYIDYAVSSYAKEFMLSLTEIDRKQLVLVEDALRRIKNKSYGKCQQCSREIGAKRLEVAPWAPLCVKCQELEEQGLISESISQNQEDEEFDFDEDEEEVDEEEDEEYDEGVKKLAGKKRQGKVINNNEADNEHDEEE